MGIRGGTTTSPDSDAIDRAIRPLRDALRRIIREAQESAPLDVASGESVTERQALREINQVREAALPASLEEIERMARSALGSVR